MSEPTGDGDVRGLALVCGYDGVVRHVVRDEIGGTASALTGRPLTEIVDPSSLEKARRFLAEAVAAGAAFDWELGIPLDGSVRLFHFAAATAPERELIVVGATSRSAVLRYYDDLMRINNEQANALRAALKRASGDAGPTARDAGVYDRMTQLNNELATLQRELTRKNIELERANAQKNQFIGMAVHDLRNPIGAIRSFAQLLLDPEASLPPAKARDFLQRIVASTEFMRTLIDDLLDLSAIESGHLRIDAREMQLAGIVRGSVELSRLLAEEKDIDIRLDVADDVPAVVVDARKIEQVLQNLLSNAVKFSPFHTTVRVSLRAEGDGALVAVADEGPGIPPDEIAGIFKPFHRGTPRGTAGERSTGLGLAIATRVMDGHGGRLWCESVVGKGSTFYAWLPARRAAP